MKSATKPMREAIARRAHFVVDGCPFEDYKQVVGACRARGFTGHSKLIARRLSDGATTFAALIAPITEVDMRRNAARATTAKRKHEEMAALVAAMDARKAGAR